ncbi:MAG TPA: TRAP transporter large permease subunit, partial [Chloroflexota bacterium]|nr:TRAP transporter large permease subunit [Chloroflexota bacterium]
AIPFFVFMGAIFEKSGLAERPLEPIGLLMGPLPGGLALAVVIVGTLLAAATGVVAATVIVMGLLALPIMVRYGYDNKLATGVIVASGTLAQLIPPSLVLVVLSQQVGVPIGDLFLGALIPGLILAGLYALYVLVVAFIRHSLAPPLPQEARTLKGWAL